MPIAGAIIGFFTNWLAIKMIFKPHTKKKIFNINMPFTPGLIPKERYNISEKIGNTVSEYILTDEVILKAIEEKNFSKIGTKVYDSFFIAMNNKSSLKEYLLETFDEETYNDINEHLKVEIDKILDKLKSPKVEEKIVTQINSYFLKLLEKEETKNRVVDLVKQLSNGFDTKKDVFIDKINDDDRKINEVLREEDIEKFKSIIHDNLDPFIAIITENFENEEWEINFILSGITEKLLIANVGKMAAMFLNPEKIYKGMREKLISYINEDKEDLIEKIDLFIDSVVSKEISQISKYISNENMEKAIGKVIVDTKDKFIMDFFEDNTIRQQLTKVYPDLSIRSKELIYKYFNFFLQNEYPKIKVSLTEEVSNFIWNIGINEIGDKLKVLPKDKVISYIEQTFRKSIETNGKELIRQMEINRIVENKINSMDIQEIENIILDVANKELKMITYLGGIIGFIIGFVPILIK